VIAYGTPLVEDPDQVGDVDALGFDEALFCGQGQWRTQLRCTAIVDVPAGQLLDVVEGHDPSKPSRCLEATRRLARRDLL
jgi:hypothetical protein